MSVDRIQRDAAAEVLADYLRGELTPAEAQSRFPAISTEDRKEGERDCSIENAWAFLYEATISPVGIDEASWWDEGRRHLAYLKSDLDATTPDSEWASVDTRDWERWHVPPHLVCLLLATTAAYWYGWWILPIAIWGSFVVFHGARSKYQARVNAQRKQESRPESSRDFVPFASEEAWLAHQHLADAFELPPYDPGRFPAPAPIGPMRRLLDNVFTTSLLFTLVLLGVIVFPLIMAVSLLAYLIIWPIWLTLKACRLPLQVAST